MSIGRFLALIYSGESLTDAISQINCHYNSVLSIGGMLIYENGVR